MTTLVSRFYLVTTLDSYYEDAPIYNTQIMYDIASIHYEFTEILEKYSCTDPDIIKKISLRNLFMTNGTLKVEQQNIFLQSTFYIDTEFIENVIKQLPIIGQLLHKTSE
jgi:hypothetical protein